MKKINIRSSILEGLQRDLHNTSIAESTKIDEGFKLPSNIDEKKFKVLQKNCNDKGYSVSGFNVYKLRDGGKSFKSIVIDRKDSRDNLAPQISFYDDKFYIHPSFMGDLSEIEAKRMADNINKACDLVSALNKIDFDEYMTANQPE